MFSYNKKTIQVDPVSTNADYSVFPKADLILITHGHGDHLDSKAIETISKEGSTIIANEASQRKIGKGTIMKNGDKLEVLKNISIEAVPAYNYTQGREGYHPRNRDNGYILTIDGTRIYIAGDTEDIPEMKQLKGIDIAFLPVMEPYAMSVTQAANAAKMFYPKILYPYHYGKTPVEKLVSELAGIPIDVRIRKMN
jgi:L-ascorbate metabolism protein UlaG (beta-lactamase superfamily)